MAFLTGDIVRIKEENGFDHGLFGPGIPQFAGNTAKVVKIVFLNGTLQHYDIELEDPAVHAALGGSDEEIYPWPFYENELELVKRA